MSEYYCKELNHGFKLRIEKRVADALTRQLRKSGWNCQTREPGTSYLKISTI